MASFVTATVWGQGRAAIKLAGTLKEGEEECQICRNDVPATVSFKPCAHNVCFACVENMRAKNIFKADKGVRCPFCRSFVDGYICVGRADAAVQKFLLEANKAASIAASARRSAESGTSGQQQQPLLQAQQQPPPRQSQAQEQAQPSMRVPQPTGAFSTETADQTWECHACSNSNYLWRTSCNRCGKQIPATLEQRLRNDHGKKDLLRVTKEELLELIVEKNHVGLNRAFFDVGMPCNFNKLSGSNASIAEAVAGGGAKRLLRIIELLVADPAAFRECALHSFGNYGIQRLLECTSRLREALGAAGRTAALAAFARSHQGRDPFAAMLAVVLPVAETYLHNEKGVYVVQCIAANANNSELLALAKAVFPECVAVSKDPKGIFALIVLLEMLRDRCLSDSRCMEEAITLVDSLCERFATSTSALFHTAGHALSGHMLMVALQVAMPRYYALDMASKIASSARHLALVPGGQQTLVELLQLHGHDRETAEALRDIAAGIAFSLQGTMGKLALGREVHTNYGAPSPQELIQTLIERLADEQEVGWLDSIINELVGVCDQLVERPECMELLKVALSLNILDLDLITAHVSEMMTLLGEAKLKPVLDEVMELVASRPPPPPPKYHSMSVMQPELAHHLNKGLPLPAPPPPPPRLPAGTSAAAPAQPTVASSHQQQQRPQQPAQQQSTGTPAAQAAATFADSEEEVWPSNDAAVGGWGQPALEETSGGSGGGGGGWGQPGLSSNDSSAAPSSSGTGANPAPAYQQANAFAQQPQVQHAPPPASFAQQQQQQWPQQPQQVQAPPQQQFAPHHSAPFNMPMPVPVPMPVTQPHPAASAASGAMPQRFPPHMQVPVPIPVPIPAPVVVPRPQPQSAAAPQARSMLPPFLAIPVPQPVAATTAAASAAPAARPQPHQAAHSAQAPVPPQLQRVPQQYGQQGAYQQQAQPPVPLLPQQQRPAPPPQQQQQQQQRQTPSPQLGRAATPVGGGVGRSGADAPAMRAPAGAQWACNVCTYVHSGAEAQFLMCALCGCERGSS